MSKAEYALEARALRKTFGGFTAVQDVDLSVAAGSIHGLIGPNGAGKTTLFNLLTKVMRPSGGSISLFGRDITGATPYQVAQLGMVRSFQISAVFVTMSALDNIRVALQRKAGLATQFWAPMGRLRALDARAEDLLARVGLSAHRHVPAGELPYGLKRALELATTLAVDPKVLLLDEPMAGIAHESIPTVVDLIRTASKGRTVVVVEHNLSVVATLCDRVTVLRRGQILAEGTYQQVSANSEVRTAYLGTAQ